LISLSDCIILRSASSLTAPTSDASDTTSSARTNPHEHGIFVTGALVKTALKKKANRDQ
jgi:hypothetical protein